MPMMCWLRTTVPSSCLQQTLLVSAACNGRNRYCDTALASTQLQTLTARAPASLPPCLPQAVCLPACLLAHLPPPLLASHACRHHARPYASPLADAAAKVTSGQGVALVFDSSNLKPAPGLQLVTTITPLLPAPYAVAVRKGDTELRNR